MKKKLPMLCLTFIFAMGINAYSGPKLKLTEDNFSKDVLIQALGKNRISFKPMKENHFNFIKKKMKDDILEDGDLSLNQKTKLLSISVTIANPTGSSGLLEYLAIATQ